MSVEQPLATNAACVTGTLTLLDAARRAGVRRLVYAGSSAAYGDQPTSSKRETDLPMPLSPYGTAKLAGEYYCRAFTATYGFQTVVIRYFNVFGARQDPKGAYAAVIPAWIDALVRGEPCRVHGDGLQTRDFCHVANVVGANLLAATTAAPAALGGAFNVGTGARTTLLELHDAIVAALREALPERTDLASAAPEFGPARPGDVRHSCADVGRARAVLGFEPAVGLRDGIGHTLGWFLTGARSG